MDRKDLLPTASAARAGEAQLEGVKPDVAAIADVLAVAAMQLVLRIREEAEGAGDDTVGQLFEQSTKFTVSATHHADGQPVVEIAFVGADRTVNKVRSIPISAQSMRAGALQ